MSGFVESNALLAVLADDDDEAYRLLRSMNAAERRELASACRDLASACEEVDDEWRAALRSKGESLTATAGGSDGSMR